MVPDGFARRGYSERLPPSSDLKLRTTRQPKSISSAISVRRTVKIVIPAQRGWIGCRLAHSLPYATSRKAPQPNHSESSSSENPPVSAVPNALLLFNPRLVLTPLVVYDLGRGDASPSEERFQRGRTKLSLCSMNARSPETALADIKPRKTVIRSGHGLPGSTAAGGRLLRDACKRDIQQPRSVRNFTTNQSIQPWHTNYLHFHTHTMPSSRTSMRAR